MKQKLNQRGFGGLEALIIIAILLLIGGIGAYLYGQRPHKAATVKTTTSSPATATGTSTTPGGVPASGGTAGSVQATEITSKLAALGISIKLPDSLNDLTYNLSMSGSVYKMNFSTSQLTAAVPACAANQGNGAFDTIIRGPGTYPGPANPSSGGLIKQYPSYYIAYVLPNAPCAKGLSPDNQKLLDDQAQAFYTAIGTIQAI